MKRLVAMAGIAAGFVAGASAAHAQGAVSQDIALDASVTSYCSISGTTTGSVSPVINAAHAVNIPTTTTGDVTVGAVAISIGTIVCNKGANIALSSAKGALLGPSSATGLQNYIDYNATTTGFPTAQASVAATVTTGTATPTAGTSVTTNAAAFSVTGGVSVTPVANASKLVYGTYIDTLTLTVTPQ